MTCPPVHTGAMGIYPPSTKILKQIERMIGPVAPDCSNRDSLPDFVMIIDGVEYTIPSSIYVITSFPFSAASAYERVQGRAAHQNVTCTSAFGEGGTDFWLLGDPFFRAIYAVLDVEQKRYGMARNVNMAAPDGVST
jgi:hypothetical protein